MCKFISGITLQDGTCLYDDSDSHSAIVEKNKLNDTTGKPDFCAWEFTPPEKNGAPYYGSDYSNWEFRIDDQFPKPEWWTAGKEAGTIQDAKNKLDKIIIRSLVKTITTGRYIIIYGGTVERIVGGTVKCIDGGTVECIVGGTVECIAGGTVERIDGGTVKCIDGGTVERIAGGTVKCIFGGTVGRIDGGTVKCIFWGTVERIAGGTVERIAGGTVGRIDGNATVVFYIPPTITPTKNGVIIDRSGKTVRVITANGTI